MSSAIGSTVLRPSRLRWWILLMLFLAITINFIDRQVLSMVTPLLRDKYHFSDTGYSIILFCFMLGMTLGQVPVGMMLDKFGTRIGFPIMVAGWSIVGMLHSAARSVFQFSILRCLLGLNECGSFSGGVKVIGEWFPPAERAFATGLFNSGCLLGAMIAPPLIVLIVHLFDWQAAFLIPGAVGCIWILPWLRVYWDPSKHPKLTPGERKHIASFSGGSGRHTVQPRVRGLLVLAPVWGVILMRAFTGPCSQFYWYWLPEYLKHDRGMSFTNIGLVSWMPFFSGGLGNIVGGWFSSLLVRSGIEAVKARKTSISVATVLCLLAALVPTVGSATSAIALICAASFGVNAISANHMAMITDLFPEHILARVSGMTGVGDGVMSMIIMLFTGIMVDHFSYLPVFVAVGLMPTVAVLSMLLLVKGRGRHHDQGDVVVPLIEPLV